MNRHRRVLGAIAVTGLALAVGPMGTAQAEGTTQPAPLLNADATGAIAGDYIVALDDTSSIDAVNDVAAVAAEAGGTVGHVYSTAVRGFSATLPADALAAVRAAAGVAYVQQDTMSQLDDLVSESSTDTVIQPNPPWGLDRIDQRETPLDNQYQYRHDGSGVSVYVIDTGVQFSHEEFEGRAITGPDFYDDDEDSTDCNGHGTHVSGTVAGKTYGVAKGATIVGLRTIDCGGFGSASDSIAAIDWVTANNEGRGVINMSLRFPADETMNVALQNAHAAGIPAAVAAGNFSQDACIESPAQEPKAVTVGASDINDQEAWFSNFGTCVDIYAPGVDVLSAYIGSDTATAVLSGTSMASPHTAGALAKLLHKFPEFTSAQVIRRLERRATDDTLTQLGPNSPNMLLFSRNR